MWRLCSASISPHHLRPSATEGLGRSTLIREYYDLDAICYFPHDDTAAGETLEDIYNNVEKALSTTYYVDRKTSALRLKSRDPQSFAKDFHIDVFWPVHR